MPAHYVRDLSGHSGCRVMLCHNDGAPFIRKQSSSAAYNERLRKQMDKQLSFPLEAVKTPRILGQGHEKDLFYFDMEYVPSQKLADYVDLLEVDDILRLLDILFLYLPLDRSRTDPTAQEHFGRKIDSLTQTLPLEQEAVFEAVHRLQEFDFSGVPRSWCCGDLTLENILIAKNKNIYLIDFLDSFYNSWMIDVAKLFQDLEFRWAYRAQPKNIHRELKLLIAKEVLIKKVTDREEGVTDLHTIYHIVLLNTLRIIPYARDAATRRYLRHTLPAIMERIDEIKEYL